MGLLEGIVAFKHKTLCFTTFCDFSRSLNRSFLWFIMVQNGAFWHIVQQICSKDNGITK